MENPIIEEIHNAHGQHYWKATAQIGSIFGAEVEGQLVGIGTSEQKSLEHLDRERHKLAESLWL